MAFNYTVKKGDTLNSIAQRYGFSNYKQAGVSSVPSGNFDLIREGESITLGNYDPNKIQGINTGSSVISSEDNAQKFKDNSNELDRLESEQATKRDKQEETGNEDVVVKTETSDEDKINYEFDKAKEKADQEAKDQQREYERLLESQFALNDSIASSTIESIRNTFAQSIEEQKRINEINIARVKAYGLGGGGRFTPISFGDAITNREREASDKIRNLENEMNSLIAQARNTQREGETALLESRIDQINEIRNQLRETYASIEKERQSQLELMREVREEEEAKHQAEVEKIQQFIALQITQDDEEIANMSNEELNSLVSQYAETYGQDFLTTYATIRGAVTESKLKNLDIKKKEADISASQALANKRWKEASKLDEEDEDNGLTDEQNKKIEQAGLKDADYATKLDYLFGDDLEREEAKAKAGSGDTMTAPDGTVIDVSNLTEEEKSELRSVGYN